MSTVEYRFLEPLDVLFLRGNKLFGDPGSYGESLVPPWPSVASGALRSRMLADDGVDLAAFAAGRVEHPVLGTPAQPGAFAITAFHLARRHRDGGVELLIALPADLVVTEDNGGKPTSVRALKPTSPAAGLLASASFAQLPVLAEETRGKAAGGYWLRDVGWRAYLAGAVPKPDELLHSADLWHIDPRVGVGLDAATHRAADGRLFSVQAVAMTSEVGFLAGVVGAQPPMHGTVRLGGDGRAAAIASATVDMPQPDYVAISQARRCRLVLTSPGLFAQGWLPTGARQTGEREFRFDLHGVRALLACAAVPRAETVSGWDLANWQPKPAQRAVLPSSVYWLDELDATPEALRKLAERGLWSDICEDPQRRAEGFNRFTFAAY